MASIGYAFLQELLDIRAFPPRRPALVKPVTRVEATPTWLAVPKYVAPTSDSLLEHVLFALKHEGVNLQILAQVLPRIAAEDLVAAIRATPGAIYLRKASYLWEIFSERQLEDLPAITGAPALLFDPKRYVTGPPVRASRWRVAFNGLGTPRYCATVERSEVIEAALASDILGRVTEFLGSLAPSVLERSLNWAYLHETQESFAIERESPSEDKAHAFVRLLQQAHERHALSEDYLAELQAATISNPHLKAYAFRTEQNWLGGSGSGATSVTYLPPPPELARELMSELMAFANGGARQVDPLVAAAVISFGFVFIHPFMDGNGRLSRFLFHQTLCRSGRLPDGLVLPISIAMRKHEADYLRALQAYSARTRRFWRVTWFDAERYDFKFLGHDSIYRYWDATDAVEFGLAMAREALELELMNETRFIERFDAIARAVNDRFDVRGSDLSQLIVTCLANHNVISKRRKDQFALRVPQPVFQLIESLARTTAENEPAKEAAVTARA